MSLWDICKPLQSFMLYCFMLTTIAFFLEFVKGPCLQSIPSLSKQLKMVTECVIGELKGFSCHKITWHFFALYIVLYYT